MKTLLIIPVLLTMLGAMSGVVAQTCVTPPSGMVGWWPGDGNTDDISGNNNNGTWMGDSDYTDPGKVDEAFTFDGSNYVEVTNNNGLFEPAHVTVDAWVRANGSPGQFKYIVAKGANGCNSGATYALYTGRSEGLFFYIYDGATFVLSPGVLPGDIWDNAWHHVAGSYDGSNVSLYVDGVKIGSTQTDIDINYNLANRDLVIGKYLDPSMDNACGNPHSFTGDIDEVELFNEALSLSAIQDIYNAGSEGKCKTIEVDIDIKPGSYPNCMNINGHGVIPVAILGAERFDVEQIDPVTLKFGGLSLRIRGNKGPYCPFEYSNDDEYLDMVCHFEDDVDNWDPGDGEATLSGELEDGTPFEGTDSICVVP